MEHCWEKITASLVLFYFFSLLCIEVTDLLREEMSWTLLKNNLSRGEDRRRDYYFQMHIVPET